jgi:glycosyltransferase involved in cell wall biosynthesis
VPERARVDVAHYGDALFDAWAARRLRRMKPVAGIVGYENGALLTFREAKMKGMITVLDAASFHHQVQDALCAPRESAAVHERIARRKEAELAVADYVLCISELAAESYRRAGLPESRIRVVPLGADLTRFSPGPKRINRGIGTPFRFAFSGTLSERKGVDVLFKAFQRVRAVVPEAELRLLGTDGEAWRRKLPDGATMEGALRQEELARRLTDADCLVLPSRHDSFGMVVIEAMASGLPVILSEQVGAKQTIEDRQHGWIVPAGDVEALAGRMTWCAQHPDEVRAMAPAVRAQAEHYSWEAYRHRVCDVLLKLLPSATRNRMDLAPATLT